jgi:hypothetical protein
MKSSLRHSALSLVCVAATAACSSSSSSSMTGPDASSARDSGASTQDSAAKEGASSKDGASSTCNMLKLLDGSVSITGSTGTAPTATGGTIVDGTYVLSSYVIFSSTALRDAGGPGPSSETISVSGSTWQVAARAPGGALAFTIKVATTGDSITETQECPAGKDVTSTGKYTASATQLELILPTDGLTSVQTYRKQ